MSTLDSPPEHIRKAFRDFLISRGSIHGLDEELKRSTFYLETLEDFISQQEAKEFEKLKAQSTHLAEEDKAEFWSYYYPVHWDEIFRSNLRSSFLISLMATTENYLNEVCRDAGIIARAPIKLSDLRGTVLEKVPLFLEKFAGFKQPTPVLWRKLSRIYDIRNVFIHSGGFIGAYQHQVRVRQFIKTSGGVTETNDFLTLKREFGLSALHVVRELSEAIAGEMKALRQRIEQEEGKK